MIDTPEGKKDKVYFAGPLFTHSELISNKLIADVLSKRSYKNLNGNDVAIHVHLPQDAEYPDMRGNTIKNQNYFDIMTSDLAIFNFNGTELDSGTVAEFMFAKSLDIPSVLFRTDFRKAGDQEEDPWNLMVSGFPRTKGLVINAMSLFKEKNCQYVPTINEICRLLLEKISEVAIDDFVHKTSPEYLYAYMFAAKTLGKDFINYIESLNPSETSSEAIIDNIMKCKSPALFPVYFPGKEDF